MFDEPLGGHAHARNILGYFVEDLTAKLFNGQRYRTDSRCEYCPDVFARGIYLECKAAGRSNQTFIYSGRLEKDRAFSALNELVYVVWHHSAYTKLAETVSELRALFLAKMKAIYVVPFAFIDAICRQLEPEPLNSKYGGTDRVTYGSGYRINVRELSGFNIGWRHG